MDKSYDFNFITFLSGGNSLFIKGSTDFNKFVRKLKKINMLGVLRGNTDYYDWLRLCKINNCDYGYILFEYNNSKGLTFGMSKEKSINWYEVEPFIIDDFEI